MKVSQVNFYNGQYDRALQGKEGSDFVRSGMFYSRNCNSSNNGELNKRLGTRFVSELSDETKIIPFRDYVSGDDLVVLCNPLSILVKKFIDNTLVDYTNQVSTRVIETWTSNTSPNGIIISAPELYNGTLTKTGLYKVFNNNRDWMTTNGMLNPNAEVFGWQVSANSVNTPNLETAEIRFQFPLANNVSKLIFNFMNIYSWTAQNDYKAVGAALLNPVIQYSDNGTDWTSVYTTSGDLSLSGLPYTETAYSGNGINNQHWSYNNRKILIVNNNETANHLYWRVIFTDTSQLLSVRKNNDWKWVMSINLYTQSTGSEVSITSPYQTYESLYNIKYAQSVNSMYITSAGIIPKLLSLIAGEITFASFTPSAPSNFWTTYGYPSCVEFFQNRLWFGGFDNFPTKLKASKFADYTSFAVSSPIVATDGLDLTSNQLKSIIKNIKGGERSLYAFSEDGISMVYGNDGNIIATGNPAFDIKNHEPVSDATPTIKDDIMYFASSMKTDVYALDFDLLVNRFKSNRMSSNATQVLAGKVKEFLYANGRNKYIYGLLEDGTMFSYLTNAVANGFFPIETSGQIKDAAVIKYGNSYKLLLVVVRDNLYYLEELPDFVDFVDTTYLTGDDRLFATIDNLHNSVSLDCYKTYKNETAQLCSYDSVNSELVINTLETSPMDLTSYIGQQIKVVNSDTDWVLLNITGAGADALHWTATIEKQRGTSVSFSAIRLPFSTFATGFPENTEFGVIGSSAYLGDFTADASGNITLTTTEFEVIFGFNYTAEARIRIENPLESMKKVQQINLATINTSHLEVGTHPDYMLEVEKQEQESSLDALPYTINKTFRMVVEDTPEWTKDIIIKSSKGLPFTITRLEVMFEGGQLKGN